MLCAPHLLFNRELAAHAWTLGSSPASKAAQAALDNPKWDCKHWAFHRANTQQPTGTNQRQGRHSVQLTLFAIFSLLASTSRIFCCRLTSLPSSDLWQAIDFNSLPESETITLLPTPSWWREQAEHGPAQAGSPVSAAPPECHRHRAGAAARSTNGHCSPAAPWASPPPLVPQPRIHGKHSLLFLMEIPRYQCTWELCTVTANSKDPPHVLLLLLCNRSCAQGILCPCTTEPSKVLASFLEGRWRCDEAEFK